jgi:hypothetical protein
VLKTRRSNSAVGVRFSMKSAADPIKTDHPFPIEAGRWFRRGSYPKI